MGASSLKPLFAPRAIAFIGASNDRTRIGGRPLSYCVREGFRGGLYPVNSGRATVQDLPAFPTLDAIDDDGLDLAVITIPAFDALQAVRDAGARGVRAAVVLSSGFAETGEAGRRLQTSLLEAAAPSGMRILGPNSLGLFSNGTGVCATFSSLLENGPVLAGPLAIASQSGAYGAHLAMLALRRGVGLSRFVTTGNEADVSLADCVAYLADDPEVGVIGCYSEGLGDGRAFLAAAERARAKGKPVVMLKVGRSEGGRKAAQAHTASVAGDDAVFAAAAREAGIERVTTTQAFVDLLYTLSRKRPVAGRSLGVLSVSGGAGVLMADAAADHGFDLTPMPVAAEKALQARIPFGSAANPVDTTAQAMNDPGLVRDALRAMLGEGGYDAVAAFFMNWPDSPTIGPALREAIAEGLAGHEGRVVALAMNGSDETTARFDAAGLLVFQDPSHAIAALAASRRIGEAFARVALKPAVAALLAPLPGGALDEAQASGLLAAAGVPMSPGRVAADPVQAAALADEFGGPVALKILSPDIPHKSDVGGVRLGLAGAEAVRAAAEAMHAACGQAAPGGDIRGFLVAPMAPSGVELIVGGRIDPTFGPVVVCGLGGVFVEIFHDVSIGLAPLGEDQALDLLRALKAWPLLDGARGRERADVSAAARAIAALSRFVASHADEIATVEVNPLRVFSKERGVLGLDAVIERRSEGAKTFPGPPPAADKQKNNTEGGRT